MKITFDKSARRAILDMFGKTVDSEKYIIDKKTNERIQTVNGEDINIERFGGIRKGSEIFLKDDLPTYIEIVDKYSK